MLYIIIKQKNNRPLVTTNIHELFRKSSSISKQLVILVSTANRFNKRARVFLLSPFLRVSLQPVAVISHSYIIRAQLCLQMLRVGEKVLSALKVNYAILRGLQNRNAIFRLVPAPQKQLPVVLLDRQILGEATKFPFPRKS